MSCETMKAYITTKLHMQAEWTQAAGDTTIDFTLTQYPGRGGVQLGSFVVHALGAGGADPDEAHQ